MTSVVCVISHSSAGGAQTLFSSLAEGLQQRGHAVRLVALYPTARRLLTPPANLPWHYIADRRPTSAPAAAMLLARLRGFLQHHAPAAAITALPAANALVPIASALAGTKTRIAISHHSPIEHYRPWQVRADRLMGASRRVNAVVCVSESVASALAHYPKSYREKARIIGNAMPPDVETLAASLSRHRTGASARRQIIATGRLAPEKNYPVLIEAMRQLPDAHLTILGDGPLEASLRDLAARLGVADRIDFRGAIPRSDVIRELAAADIFVLPSHYEGHSLGLIEAASVGLPLLASDIDVHRKGLSLSDGRLAGRLVDRHDPTAVASAIRQLLDDPAHYADYANRARDLAAGSSFAAMVDAYEALIH